MCIRDSPCNDLLIQNQIQAFSDFSAEYIRLMGVYFALPYTKPPIRPNPIITTKTAYNPISFQTPNFSPHPIQKARAKGIRKSLLDQIEGIGSMRKRALLNHFGSARSVESASFDEIKSVEGVEEKVAKKIYNFFHE